MKPRKRAVGEILDHSLGLFAKVSPEEMESSREQALKYLEAETGNAVQGVMLKSETVRPVRKSRWLAAAATAAAIAVAVFVPARVLRSAPAVLEDGAGSRKIHYGEVVSPKGEAGGTLKLPDGSQVEMRMESELSLERAKDGVRIRVRKGDVIVNAAEPPAGPLYVETKDMSAIGKVFLVNAKEEGSRVAAIGGETRVQQGATEKRLFPGEQVATNPQMQSQPISQEVSWSRHAGAHLVLLQQSAIAPSPASPRGAFVVASIRTRPSGIGGGRGLTPVGGGGGGGACSGRGLQIDPQRFAVTGASLRFLITLAYSLDDSSTGFGVVIRCSNAIKLKLLSGGPEWIDAEAYDIEALMPAGLTPSADGTYSPRLLGLLQTLLADRFKLVVRRQTKEMPGYALTEAKGGRKLRESKQGDPPGGIPALVLSDGTASIRARKTSMKQLASRLATALNRPVVDRSGIKGDFDFIISFFPTEYFTVVGASSTAFVAGPSLFTVLEEELGLKLESERIPMDVLVIDHVEKPSEN